MLRSIVDHLSITDTEYLYVISFAIVIVLAMVTMIYIANKNIFISKKQRFRFTISFVTILLICLADLGSSLIEIFKRTDLRWLDYSLSFWGLCCTLYIPVGLSKILRNDKRNLIVLSVFHVFVIIFMILTGLKLVFVIDDDMNYVPQLGGMIYYFIGYVGFALYLLIDALILSRKLLARKTIAIFTLFIILIVSTSLLLQFEHIRFTYLIVGLISIIFYVSTASMMSQIDGLTGLFSQFAFIKFAPSIKKGQYIFVMDCDDFKKINDKYGHMKGDDTLKAISKVIQQTFGRVGKSFRIGGDEFISVVKAGSDCHLLIETFKSKINELKNGDYTLPNVSIGYSLVESSNDYREYEALADKYMYLDKIKNKNHGTDTNLKKKGNE